MYKYKYVYLQIIIVLFVDLPEILGFKVHREKATSYLSVFVF